MKTIMVIMVVMAMIVMLVMVMVLSFSSATCERFQKVQSVCHGLLEPQRNCRRPQLSRLAHPGSYKAIGKYRIEWLFCNSQTVLSEDTMVIDGRTELPKGVCS